MRILFDQGTPVPLRHHLSGHLIVTAYELEWSTLENGDLIRSADAEGFDLLVTTDSNLKYQQNLRDRRIAILVLLSTSWPKIHASVDRVKDAVARAGPGSYSEVGF